MKCSNREFRPVTFYTRITSNIGLTSTECSIIRFVTKFLDIFKLKNHLFQDTEQFYRPEDKTVYQLNAEGSEYVLVERRKPSTGFKIKIGNEILGLAKILFSKYRNLELFHINFHRKMPFQYIFFPNIQEFFQRYFHQKMLI